MRTAPAFVLACWVIASHPASAQTSVALGNIQDIPPGSLVRVTMRGDITQNGVLREVDAEFIILELERPTRRQNYRRDGLESVAILRVAQSFRATGTPNAEQVSHVVKGLGIGTTVNVSTISGRQLRAQIRSIDEREFALQARDGAALERVAFADVDRVSPHSRHVARWVALASVGVAVYLYVLWANAGGQY